MVLLRPINEALSSAWYALSISLVLIGALWYLFALQGDIRQLRRDHEAIAKRLDDVDLHGTRTLPLAEQRMNNADIRLNELARRLSDIESSQRLQDQRLDVTTERQNNVLRRLDKLEGAK